MGAATGTKREMRIEARLTARQKRLIERAAAVRGQSVSRFLVSSAQEAAAAVLQERSVIKLNAAESRAFAEALLNPAPLNPALRQAAREYRELLAAGKIREKLDYGDSHDG